MYKAQYAAIGAVGTPQARGGWWLAGGGGGDVGPKSSDGFQGVAVRIYIGWDDVGGGGGGGRGNRRACGGASRSCRSRTSMVSGW